MIAHLLLSTQALFEIGSVQKGGKKTAPQKQNKFSTQVASLACISIPFDTFLFKLPLSAWGSFNCLRMHIRFC